MATRANRIPTAALCISAGLALAGVAFAAPAGPGGTLYFSAFDDTGAELRYYYLDVDRDWNALGNVVQYATVHDDTALEPKLHADGEAGYQNRTPAGFTDIIPNAASGLQDMGGAFHNARLFQAIYHNDAAYSGTGTRGADYLAVNPDGTATILNDGVYGTANPNTTLKRGTAIIGGAVTPNGESWAILSEDYNWQNAWTGTFRANGMVTVSSPGTAPNLRTTDPGYQDRIRWAVVNCSVGGTAVKGVIALYNDQIPPTSGGFYGGWRVGYKNATGTGYSILSVPAADTGTGGGLTGSQDNFTQWDIADTDGNGVPDVYFQSTLGKFAHAADKNGDGDWIDGSAESWDSGIPNSGGDMTLVRAAPADAVYPGGRWAMLQWVGEGAYGGANTIRIYGLNAAGDWDGAAAKVIIDAGTDNTLSLPVNNSLTQTPHAQRYAVKMTFVPLGQQRARPPAGTAITIHGGSAGDTNALPGSGIIPDERLADWRAGVVSGVPGGIPTNRTHLIDVTKAPYYADPTGAADAQPAIMQAIAVAASNDVVYLPAGTYRIDSTIYVGTKSWLTIRGAGPESTLVLPRAGSGGISVGAGGADWWYSNRLKLGIAASAPRGATVLTLADTTPLNASPYNGGIGQTCQLCASNDVSIPVVAPAHYEYLRRQVSRIVAKTATTVTISPPLLFDLPQSQGPRLAPVGFLVQSVGIEDLSMDGTNSTSTLLIGVSGAYACWIRNVTLLNTRNYHISISDALQCEIRNCRLSTRLGDGSNGAGLLVGTSSFCLFEDNIIARQFPSIEVNSSCGNVFGYNFCYDSTIYGVLGCAINCNHGGHNCFNLYEGNVAPNIQCDGYHGSASHDTIYRNWFHGDSPGAEGHWTVALNRFTRKYSLVGNILGKAALSNGSYSFGNPNMGNGDHTGTAQPSAGDWWTDWPAMLASPMGGGPGPGGFQELDLDVEATTFLKGNFNYATNGVPAGESLGGVTLPRSLYLKAKPAWFGGLSWPPFGPDAPLTNRIPAQVRF